MNPDSLVDYYLNGAPTDELTGYVEALCALDRYQASRGIEQTAQWVAEAAEASGLEEVEVVRFPANGERQWWSFSAPTAWTPLTAQITFSGPGKKAVHLDHSLLPLAIATYSAPTPPGGAHARLVVLDRDAIETDIRGAIVVVPEAEVRRGGLANRLASRGAIGFVTDAGCVRVGGIGEYRGRLELPPSSPVFGFSLTRSESRAVEALARDGGTAEAVVEIDSTGSMPVVTGALAGSRRDQEVWLTAHLCHPRPGANDNASGVAALLGTASMLAGARHRLDWNPECTVRFLWGPEFLGTVAFLRRQIDRVGDAGRPRYNINLDMVGEDQASCRSPFVLEHASDLTPTLLDPAAQAVVDAIFRKTPAGQDSWESIPFTGFSDHALFADPNLSRAAVHFSHPGDRFNHSGGDTLDKVSGLEMKRSCAAAATLAHISASGWGDASTWIRSAVGAWSARQAVASSLAEQRYRWVADGSWSSMLGRYTRRRIATMTAHAKGSTSGGTPRPVRVGRAAEPVVRGRWSGPVNVRAMLEAASPGAGEDVLELIRADKINLSHLFNFAIRADGTRTQREIVTETSLAARRPVLGDVADRLFGAMFSSGWVTGSQ